MTTCKLSVVGAGLAVGVFWGLSIILMAIMAHFSGYGMHFVEFMGKMYLGYEDTVMGSFVGGGIAFFDGFISGCVLALLYNFFSARCGK